MNQLTNDTIMTEISEMSQIGYFDDVLSHGLRIIFSTANQLAKGCSNEDPVIRLSSLCSLDVNMQTSHRIRLAV